MKFDKSKVLDRKLRSHHCLYRTFDKMVRGGKFTEKDMELLLWNKYSVMSIGNTQRYTRARQVRNFPHYVEGYFDRFSNPVKDTFRSRSIDYLVIDGQGSNDMIGFEIKVSRQDFLAEIKNPEKSQESFKRFCNQWYVVVPDKDIVKEDLPDGWGMMCLNSSGLLYVSRKSEMVKYPETMDGSDISQLTRAVYKTALWEKKEGI